MERVQWKKGTVGDVEQGIVFISLSCDCSAVILDPVVSSAE